MRNNDAVWQLLRGLDALIRLQFWFLIIIFFLGFVYFSQYIRQLSVHCIAKPHREKKKTEKHEVANALLRGTLWYIHFPKKKERQSEGETSSTVALWSDCKLHMQQSCRRLPNWSSFLTAAPNHPLLCASLSFTWSGADQKKWKEGAHPSSSGEIEWDGKVGNLSLYPWK